MGKKKYPWDHLLLFYNNSWWTNLGKVFFLILSVYVFEKRRMEVRWYIITEVNKENEWKRRKVTGQLKK